MFAGIGMRVAADNHNEMVPDMMIVPPGDDLSDWTFEIWVAFEVLSPGSVRREMVRKREFHIPSLGIAIPLAELNRQIALG